MENWPQGSPSLTVVQAHPDVGGTEVWVGVQAMWSPFQESQALRWGWTVLLRPQQD